MTAKNLEPGYQNLRFVGKVLIGITTLTLLVVVYRIIQHQSYNLSLSLIGLVAGVFLWRERVKASHKIAWIAGFFIAVGLGGMVAYFLFMPNDLVLIFIKLKPMVVLGNIIYPLSVTIIAFWVFKRLTRASVKAIWTRFEVKFNGFFSKPAMGFNLGIGIIVATLVISLALARSPEYAALTTIAINQAKPQVSAGYQFWVADINQQTKDNLSSGTATVYAYQKDKIKTLNVSWKDQRIDLKLKPSGH